MLPENWSDDVPTSEQLSREATAALEGWRPTVVAIPRWTRGVNRAQPLADLVRWYERICRDPDCLDPPPIEGLDALVDELAGAPSDGAREHLGVARWAMRVAEELVHWRAKSRHGADGAPARVAKSRLELALRSARRHAASAS